MWNGLDSGIEGMLCTFTKDYAPQTGLSQYFLERTTHQLSTSVFESFLRNSLRLSISFLVDQIPSLSRWAFDTLKKNILDSGSDISQSLASLAPL